MNIADLFKNIKKAFSVKRVIDFDDFDLHFELQPLTAKEELMVLEACNGREGGAFISELKRSSLAYSIKKINNVEFIDDIVEYPEEDGTVKKETKYLFMIKQIDSLPASFRDTLFEAFNNLQLEIEDLVTKKAKFERFKIQENPTPSTPESTGIPKGFRKIEESPEENSKDSSTEKPE